MLESSSPPNCAAEERKKILASSVRPRPSGSWLQFNTNTTTTRGYIFSSFSHYTWTRISSKIVPRHYIKKKKNPLDFVLALQRECNLTQRSTFTSKTTGAGKLTGCEGVIKQTQLCLLQEKKGACVYIALLTKTLTKVKGFTPSTAHTKKSNP